MISEDAFIEWAQVHSNMYGTAKVQITKIQKEKKIPLLDIDVQGALNFYKAFPRSNFFAFLPKDTQVLKARLLKRGTETKEKIDERVKNAKSEIRSLLKNKHIFHYKIINDDLEMTKKTMLTLVSSLYGNELIGKSVKK